MLDAADIADKTFFEAVYHAGFEEKVLRGRIEDRYGQ
jgi:hypothetical protein